MTGRSWRHFSVFWPFMLAGAVGPRDETDPGTALLDGAPVAPASNALRLRPRFSDGSSTDSDSNDGSQSETSGEADNSVEAARVTGKRAATSRLPRSKEGQSQLPGPDVVRSPAYVEFFGSMPIHDAVLDTFCRAARLGGALFGDNIADTTALTGEQITAMEDEAHLLGVDCIQTLYGHVNTSKLHRLVHHLGEELRARGNLWEGDTSENERLHASCKRMFRRSNKRGPNVTLQMMRCDEAQSAVLLELQASDEESDDEANGTPATVSLVRTADVSFSGRGTRMALGTIQGAPALAKVGALLKLPEDAWVTLHNTARIMARFEWGAPPTMQHLRASRNFMNKPWFSFVRYETVDGVVRWGRVRLVLRSLGRVRRSCVVAQRLRCVAARPNCVLSRYGCQRLAWEFDTSADEYPGLDLVDATRILRAEDVQVDWFDLSERLGLFATPTNKTINAAERRAERYFTNPFFPWTSRDLRPGL